MIQEVAVIGAGPVGRSLAGGLAAAGHVVRIGVRRPDDAKHDDIRRLVDVVAIADAIRDPSVVILAVPAESLAALLGRLELAAGQVVVDATNAVFTPVPDGFATLGDFVGSLIPDDVPYVKAFNTVGAEHLAGRPHEQPTFLPIAGDEAATSILEPLARDLGFDVTNLGGRDAIGMVEDHARLWIHLALKQGWGRDLAFAIVRR